MKEPLIRKELEEEQRKSRSEMAATANDLVKDEEADLKEGLIEMAHDIKKVTLQGICCGLLCMLFPIPPHKKTRISILLPSFCMVYAILIGVICPVILKFPFIFPFTFQLFLVVLYFASNLYLYNLSGFCKGEKYPDCWKKPEFFDSPASRVIDPYIRDKKKCFHW